MTQPAAHPKAVVVIGFILVVLVAALHVHAVIVGAGREPHVDETESLHAAWLMRNGERLYVTFFEHHSPFLFATLSALAPVGEGVPARPFFMRARWVAGFAGLLALGFFALAVKPAAPEAPGFLIALLFAAGVIWIRGFAEARAEPFSLALFGAGLVLVLRKRGIASGLGIALVVASALWNPKWPVACLAVGLIFLYRARRDVRAYVTAIAGSLVAILAIALVVPLDVWWFFNFDVNLVLSRAVQNTQWALDAYFAGGKPFLFVPDAFHPAIVIPAAAIVGASLAIRPELSRAWPLVLLAASLIELRFFLPWPAIWSHYYLMWSIASAAVLALVPVSIDLLLRRAGARDRVVVLVRTALVVVGAILATAHVLALRATPAESSTFWVSEQYLRARLRPGDSVWLDPTRHPVTVRDAHYYWFLPGQMIPAARELRKSERGRRYLPAPEELPTCVPDRNLRFTLDPRALGLEPAAGCMDALVRAQSVRKTVFADVWEVRLIKSAGSSGKVVQ